MNEINRRNIHNTILEKSSDQLEDHYFGRGTNRIIAILKENGITTIPQLLNTPAGKLLKFKNFGGSSLHGIEYMFERMGVDIVLSNTIPLKGKKKKMSRNDNNLCFCREPQTIHDVLLETTDETKFKEGLIGLSSVVGEMEQNHIIMARRLNVIECEIIKLQEGIKKLADSLGVIL